MSNENILGTMPIKKLLIKFSVPAIIAMLVNSLYNIVDQIFIGHKIGYIGNTATTVSFPIMTISLAIGLLFSSGASAYSSIKLGEKKPDIAENTIGNMLSILVITSIIFSGFCLLFLEDVLIFFGATVTSLPYAKEYTSIILLGVPFAVTSIGLSNIARVDGNSKIAMISLLTGAGVNIILDPIYLFVFEWGMKGAAIATITSQIISVLILGNYFFKHSKLKFRLKYLKLNFKILGAFTILGLSNGLTQLTASLTQIILNNSLVYYGNLSHVTGDVALSAMGIVAKISILLVSINIGISNGCQPIFGFNRGAKNFSRIKETYILAIKYATIFSFFGWVICMFFPNLILMLIGSTEGIFFDFTKKALRIYLFGTIFSGFQIITSSYFQSTGQPKVAAVLSVLRQGICLIPSIIILPTIFGLDGILYAGFVSDFISTFIVALLVKKELTKLNKKII